MRKVSWLAPTFRHFLSDLFRFKLEQHWGHKADIPHGNHVPLTSNPSVLAVQNQPRTLLSSKACIITCKLCALVEQKCCCPPLPGALGLLRSASLLLLLYRSWRWLPLASFSSSTLKPSHHYVNRLSRLLASWPFQPSNLIRAEHMTVVMFVPRRCISNPTFRPETYALKISGCCSINSWGLWLRLFAVFQPLHPQLGVLLPPITVFRHFSPFSSRQRSPTVECATSPPLKWFSKWRKGMQSPQSVPRAAGRTENPNQTSLEASSWNTTDSSGPDGS